jgi:hypothetical protein
MSFMVAAVARVQVKVGLRGADVGLAGNLAQRCEMFRREAVKGGHAGFLSAYGFTLHTSDYTPLLNDAPKSRASADD